MVPDGVLDAGPKGKLKVAAEFGLQMDNDEEAVEERATEKETKYQSTREVLRVHGGTEKSERTGLACIPSVLHHWMENFDQREGVGDET
eukprot:73226-Rhodomonas_salina.1